VPSDDEASIVKKLKLVGEPFFVVPCLGDITACAIVVEKDMEQKTELVKNLISNARIILTMDAKESEFRVDLTKTDFKILEQLLKNPKEKIDAIAKSTKLSTKTVTRTIEKFETNQVKFTWIGGEDKTSLVMGNGRPFFAKLLSPKKRNVRLAKKSNLDEIMIHALRKIDHIPNGSIHFKSKIKMLVLAKNDISSNKLKRLKQLVTVPIEITDSNNKQHKRAIHKLKYKKNSLQSFTVEIEADGGIPIKRFVDGFNIIPNISSILGIQCSCEKFDINQIYLSK